MNHKTCWLFVVIFAGLLGSRAAAQAPADPQPGAGADPRYVKFSELLNGVKLVGKFTVQGKDNDKLPTEEYEIKSVTKLPEGDKWLFQARVKYGKFDVTVPMALDVKWSGDTPVITLDEVTIPGLGTFSCRVLFDGGKYAGTWTHGKAGGHMFGVLQKADAAAANESAKPEKPAGDK